MRTQIVTIRFLLASMLLVLFTAPAGATVPSENAVERISQELARGGAPKSAVLELGNLLEKDPNNYQAHFLLGSCYDRLGLPDQAMDEYGLANKYGPDDPKPLVYLVRRHEQLGDRDVAAKIAAIGYARFPSDPNLAFMKGNYLLLEKKDLKQVEKLFNQALASKAFVPDLGLGLARLLLAQKKYEEAFEQANKILIGDPNNAYAQCVKGESLYALKRYSQAREPMKLAYNQYLLTPWVAMIYAQCAYWTQHYEDALEPCMVQIFLTSTADYDDPKAVKLFSDVAAKVDKQKLLAAVTKTSASLEKKFSGSANPHYYHRAFAQVASKFGLHDLAVGEYGQCLRYDPHDYKCLFWLGKEFELYFAEYDSALKCYWQAKGTGRYIPDIDACIAHLQGRLLARKYDLAWQLKDWFNLQDRLLAKRYDDLTRKTKN